MYTDMESLKLSSQSRRMASWFFQ